MILGSSLMVGSVGHPLALKVVGIVKYERTAVNLDFGVKNGNISEFSIFRILAVARHSLTFVICQEV
jgi:hypothetical protein